MYCSPLLRPWQFQVVRFKVVEGSNWAAGDRFGVAAPSLIAATRLGLARFPQTDGDNTCVGHGGSQC